MSRDFSNDPVSPPVPGVYTRGAFREISAEPAGGQGEVRPEAAFADWSAPSSSQPVTRMEAILDPLPPRLVYSYLSLPFHSIPFLSLPFHSFPESRSTACVAGHTPPCRRPFPYPGRHLCASPRGIEIQEVTQRPRRQPRIRATSLLPGRSSPGSSFGVIVPVPRSKPTRLRLGSFSRSLDLPTLKSMTLQ